MKRTLNILLIIGSVVPIAATVFVISVKPAGTTAVPTAQLESTPPPSLPPLKTISPSQPEGSGIAREIQLHTHILDRPSNKIVQYTVQEGDSPSSIAKQFDLQPETILWGNEGLSAGAGNLKIGMSLSILPVDGVLHTVQEGDTLERLETLHGIPAQDIFEFPGNDFDLTQPAELALGQQIIIPNGQGPILWQAPGPVVVSGQGRNSPGFYSGALINFGTGYFIWPVNSYNITQEFWSGHAGIDVSTDFRQPIFASDSGTVIFSGWDDTGFGNLIIIDHGNGYWTYYGHNEANLVSVGQGVVQGQQIAESGKTGNSTGNHIDFRIRADSGAFLNPFDFLP